MSSLPVPPTPSTTAPPSPPCVAPPDDHQWFNNEVHPHDGLLKAYLRSRFPSVRDIDDLAQESYLRIWKARATTKFESAKSFLLRIAHNLALDQIRRDKRAPVKSPGDLVLENVMEDKPNAADLLTEQEKIDLITDAVVALPARTREIFFLVRFKGIRQDEVAAQLGITRKVVEHQLARGHDLCEKYLRSRGAEFF